MALSDNKLHYNQRPEMSFPRPPVDVAASQTIYQGAFVALNAAGKAVPAPATGEFVFAGIAKDKYVSGGSVTTDRPLEFLDAGILKHAVTGAAITNIGNKVYYIGDDALSMTIVPATGVAGSQVGRLHGFHADGTPLVDMTKVEY